MPRPRLASLLALLALLAAFALVACGDDDSGGGQSLTRESTGAGTEEATADTEEQAAPADLKDTSTKPVVEKPTGSPPEKLVVEDIVKGKGRAAKPGDQLTMQYVGVSFSTGEQFDASWDSGQPFVFTLGTDPVIEGWEKGIPGMRVGGRRQLTIPPGMAYGTQGSPPAIGPNETLVFVVDLVAID